MLKLPEKFDEADYGERWLKLVEATPLGDRRDPHLGVDSIRRVNEECPDGVTDLLIEYDAYDDDGGALGTAVICLTRMCGAAVRPWATKMGTLGPCSAYCGIARVLCLVDFGAREGRRLYLPFLRKGGGGLPVWMGC